MKEGFGRGTDADSFRPEICLSNRIIEDLTTRYRSQLLPLDLKSCKPRKKPGVTSRKGVTFLDEKLKNGFVNAAFVHSPTTSEGVVESTTRTRRPRPIASPSEEFLRKLDEPGRLNEAFEESPATAEEPWSRRSILPVDRATGRSGRRSSLGDSNPLEVEDLPRKHGSMSKLPTQRQSCSYVNASHREFANCSSAIDLGQKGMDFWVDSFKANNKKKFDKINKINIHLHALFSAVEHGHVEKARTILESTDVDVNSLNSDNLTPLDVAVLTNHRSLAKMLLAFGAQEGNHFQTPERLGAHLKSLVAEAEKRIQDINGGLMASEQAANANRSSGTTLGHQASSVASCHHGVNVDAEKELILWEKKSKGLKKMLLGFEQTRPPEVPQLVAVDVTGTNSVSVRFQGPEHQDSSICTKFKVQWSKSESFDAIAGEREMTDVKQLECSIGDLSHGQRYWFRMACGNLKGYGSFKSSTPVSVVPSSWRDGQGQEPRFAGRLHQLDDLFAEIRSLRPENASEIKDFSDAERQGETPALQRRNQKKKTTIKHLFTVTGKFQKSLKRGIYLVSLFYHDDRVLVTNEDFLPAVEVDETYPSSIYNDLHWFMKVACTWSDVKSLRQDMEKNLTSTTSHFRIKLLQAAQQMQSSLSTHDLGQLYYKPIRDAQGTLVFCTINHCPTPKSISVLNLRWTPIGKLQKKIFASEESNISELLMSSIPSQITYHQHSNIKLSRGLYLGYLKMKSSVDLIQIIVPSKTPNVLPHCKIRDNPHISSEEWDWLKRSNGRHKSGSDNAKSKDETAGREQQQQQMFVEQVANTARRLFSFLDVHLDDAMSHRLYDLEVVDLNPEISFLIIVPPAETSCSVPGQKDALLERSDFMSVPVQVFEMVHLGTYQPEVISRYSRLSCILELDVILAQHSHREAFSSSEVQLTKSRLSKLQELQTQLNGVWKSVRWIMDVIAFARDRGSSSASPCSNVHAAKSCHGSCGKYQTSLTTPGAECQGVTMKHLLSLTRKKSSSSSGSKKSPTKSKCLKENHHVKCEKRSLLQIPDSPKDPKLLKSNQSSGSWPGPGVENGSCLLETSFSKSEQHLNVIADNDDAEVKPFARKYSGSDCSGSSHYVTIKTASGSTVGNHSKFASEFPGRKIMTNLGNWLPFSKSEDHLLTSRDLRSLRDACGESRGGKAAAATMSVSASNSPLLPPKNLCNNLATADSLLSIANTNTSGSLRSLSSDESTAAVVSLPVTVPLRGGSAAARLDAASVQHSASLLSLAKPIIPANPKPKSSVRVVNPPTTLIPSGSILSGNAIPVNISQIPARNTEPCSNRLNRHVSSSLPSFAKASPRSRHSPVATSPTAASMSEHPPDAAGPAREAEASAAEDLGSGVKVLNPTSGVLQVYAAYETGLAAGTSLKLHVTPRTSAREVVDLVVKQLNMAVLLKGKDGPIYLGDRLKNFCLVAVIGARERCLRDDFKPLQLQNPWKKGRLYVRQKQDVLAALEHSSRQSAFL